LQRKNLFRESQEDSKKGNEKGDQNDRLNLKKLI
jgi:hypothetical protein